MMGVKMDSTTPSILDIWKGEIEHQARAYGLMSHDETLDTTEEIREMAKKIVAVLDD
jgi:hypothetical protein